MKKIKYILCACLMMASLGMEAKSMKDLLVSMPDSMTPALNSNLRLEFAELQEMGVKAEVKNLLGEASVMDTLAQDFVQIRLSSASTLQMKKLPMELRATLCSALSRPSPDRRRRANCIFSPRIGKPWMQVVFSMARASGNWQVVWFRNRIR